MQLIYVDCDSLVLSIRTLNFINDYQNLENPFDFSNLEKIHELLKDKKNLGNLKLKHLKNSER